MTGEELKHALADEVRRVNAEAREHGQPEPYLLIYHADGRHGPAEGMPDLRILGPLVCRQTCVDLECKSAREKLRPAQQRYADAACQVSGQGYVYAVVRQTPEAPGELAARTVAFMLGLVDLARRLPAPGPGAVFEERPAPSPIGESAVDIGDPEVMGKPLSRWPEPARSRMRAELVADMERRRAAGCMR